MKWTYINDSNEFWRFDVFGPSYQTEDAEHYWIVYKFDGSWDVKHCTKFDGKYQKWMGGCIYLIGLATPEEAIAYAEKESIRLAKRNL